eukprot:GDKJ01040617.1.p1 GENE.GDKJ01040617.1~~GDKJ01040617.1.p1  ORF type:complete len:307 (+),score=77.59 GDKJ01040617.1:26-946(+)
MRIFAVGLSFVTASCLREKATLQTLDTDMMTAGNPQCDDNLKTLSTTTDEATAQTLVAEVTKNCDCNDYNAFKRVYCTEKKESASCTALETVRKNKKCASSSKGFAIFSETQSLLTEEAGVKMVQEAQSCNDALEAIKKSAIKETSTESVKKVVAVVTKKCNCSDRKGRMEKGKCPADDKKDKDSEINTVASKNAEPETSSDASSATSNKDQLTPTTEGNSPAISADAPTQTQTQPQTEQNKSASSDSTDSKLSAEGSEETSVDITAVADNEVNDNLSVCEVLDVKYFTLCNKSKGFSLFIQKNRH